MNRYQIMDLQATVLDDRELDILQNALRQEFATRRKRYESIPMMRAKGKMTDGSTLLMAAESFETFVEEMPITDIVHQTTEHVFSVDMLAQEDPTYYELPHINGKNIRSALERLVGHVINTDQSDRGRQAEELKAWIAEYFVKAIEYQSTALNRFNTLVQKLPAIADFRSRIDYKIAVLRREKLFYETRTNPINNSVAYVKPIIQESLAVFGLLQNIFKKDVFLEMNDVAGALIAIGNTTILLYGEYRKYGASCLYTASKIIGPHPRIIEPLSTLKELIEKEGNI